MVESTREKDLEPPEYQGVSTFYTKRWFEKFLRHYTRPLEISQLSVISPQNKALLGYEKGGG
jgi:hypothetical protein